MDRRKKSMSRRIHTLKRVLVKEIMDKVTPLMWESGYTKGSLKDYLDGERRALKIFWFPDREKYVEGYKDSICYYKIGDMEVEGFTEEGSVIVDAHAGGMIHQQLIDIQIENLMKIHTFVINDPYKVIKERVEVVK